MSLRNTLGAVVAAWLLSACSLLPSTPQAVHYDFGPPPATTAQPAPVLAWASVQVLAPPWLETPALLYRLEYRDAAQLASYRDSRWAATPAALLAERLRQRAAQAPAGVPAAGLRVELEEFCHSFSAPDRSRGLLRLRAALIEPTTGRMLRQRSFAVEADAQSSDAAGGAHALARAADDAITQVLAWAAAG